MSDAVFAGLEAILGARLFTVSVQDEAAGVARRVYSNDPVTYPLTVPKPIQHDAWSDLVLGQGRTFVANSVAEFGPHFFDHALLEAMGLRSAVNVPVIWRGRSKARSATT